MSANHKHSTSVPPSLRTAYLHSSQSVLALRSQGTASRHTSSRRKLSSDVDEQREVELLNDWNKPTLNTDELAKMRAAAFGMTARTGKNDVEKFILQRRNKGTTARVSESSGESLMKHIQEVSSWRLLKKEEENLNKERSKNARRYEEELQSTLISLQAKLQLQFSQAKSLREEASHHRQLIADLELSLRSSRKSFLQTDSLARLGLKSLRPEEALRFASRKSQHQVSMFSREQECRERVVLAKDAICQLRLAAEEADRKAEEAEKELAEAKRVQINHYCMTLKDGRDTRAQGLAWVVKRLWKAGKSVDGEMFPEFLDEESIRIVLFIAQKSMEADDLSEHLLSIKPPSSTADTRNTQSHWNNIYPRLKALTTNLSRKHPKSASNPIYFQVSSVPSEETVSVRNPATSEVLSQYTDVKTIEARIKELHEVMQKVQSAEVRRLTTECFLNSYEKRFNVSLRTLLAAIVGVDVLDRYIAIVNKEQKTLAEQLSQTKTFYFMSSNS